MPNERVLPVVLSIKPLDDELCQKKLHLRLLRILGQLSWEKHFADTLNSYLPQNTILHNHVVLNDDSMQLKRRLRINPMYDEGINWRFKRDYLLSKVVILVVGKNCLEDPRVILEELFVQQAK